MNDNNNDLSLLVFILFVLFILSKQTALEPGPHPGRNRGAVVGV